MTVGPTVEIRAAGLSAPGLPGRTSSAQQAPGLGLKDRWPIALASGESVSTKPSAESFRSNWQSQLDSLGAGADASELKALAEAGEREIHLGLGTTRPFDAGARPASLGADAVTGWTGNAESSLASRLESEANSSHANKTGSQAAPAPKGPTVAATAPSQAVRSLERGEALPTRPAPTRAGPNSAPQVLPKQVSPPRIAQGQVLQNQAAPDQATVENPSSNQAAFGHPSVEQSQFHAIASYLANETLAAKEMATSPTNLHVPEPVRPPTEPGSFSLSRREYRREQTIGN